MVRDLKKPVKGLEELEAMEKATYADMDEIEKRRQKLFERENELNSGFYFSVVFNSRDERDKWLEARGLKLEEDCFIKARDFKI